MRINIWRTPVLCLAAAVSLIALVGPAVADDEIKVDKKVKIKVIKCEDGDCQEMIENFVGEDVKVIFGDGMNKKIVIRKIHCEGEDCEENEGLHKIVFVGDDGDVQVMAGGDGHAWFSHDCEGDDCEEYSGNHRMAGNHKMVFVGGDGDVQVMAGDGAHAWFSRHGGFGGGGGYLGVGLTELTPELREHFGVPAGAGVMVSKVMDDSPAFKAGLEVGDIIAGVDGETIAGGSALGKNIRSHEAGEEVVLNVWRDGAVRSITAALEERKGGGLHAEHMGDLHKKMRKIMIHCDSDDEDCESNFNFDFDFETAGLDDFDCGGSAECDVRVECEDDGCTCTINGEDADCADIPGVPAR